MRKLYLCMVMALALCGCERIPEGERLIPTEEEVSGNRTHVLLEFTGFRCVNCPTAAQTAQTLLDLYGDHLTVVALHPASNPFTQGKYDYTCPAADSIYRYMGGTASTPFPTGNIDLKAVNGQWFFDHEEWPAQVSRAMEDSLFPPLSRLKDYRTAYWLVEDSVSGVQAMPDGSVNMNYYHRHLLRAVSDVPDMPVPDGCNPDRCTLLKLIIDNTDNHIMNVYETKLLDAPVESAVRH